MEKLFEAFKGYEFFSDDHHYEINGKRVGTSVTTLIHDYSKPFDKEEVSKKVALKTGQNQEDILEKWRLENLFSTVKGTLVHEYAQGLWNDKEIGVNYDEIEELDIERLKKSMSSSCLQAKKFYDDNKDTLKVLKDEFIVGSEEYDIAGSIDNLLLNRETNDLILLDYKTNKAINFNSFNNERMLFPLDNLEDCNYIHYSLQLNIYKILIEKYSDVKVKNVFIVYFDEKQSDYKKLKVLNLKNESMRLLETRIC